MNGETVPGLEQVEGYAGKLEAAKPIDLGVVKPDGNVIRLKVEVVGKSPLSKGYDMVLDAVTLSDDVDNGSMTLASLLNEMTDREALARLPQSAFTS